MSEVKHLLNIEDRRTRNGPSGESKKGKIGGNPLPPRHGGNPAGTSKVVNDVQASPTFRQLRFMSCARLDPYIFRELLEAFEI